MKKIVILYNQPLSGVQGINYVNNSFVEGNKYFKKNGLILDKIIGSDRIFVCKDAKSLHTIGNKTTSKVVTRDSRVKNMIKKLFSNKVFLWSVLRVYIKCYLSAKKTIANFKTLNENPDYIIFQDPQSALYYFRSFPNSKSKTILILHCSDHPMEQDRSMFPGLYNSTKAIKIIQGHYDYVMDKVDKVIYLSQHAVNASVLPSSRKTYIFNGQADIHGLKLSGIVHNPLNIVCVGSMAWRKGQDFIIKAMSLLSDKYLSQIMLHLIGSGPQLDELKRMVADNKLTKYVRFYGSRNDVPELLEEMDVFILPSESEGLPMSMIEALRQGLYVIATNTGAIPEMIKPEFGQIVCRDANSIANSLIKCLDERLVSHESQKRARDHYLHNFTLEVMINQYSSVLNQLQNE